MPAQRDRWKRYRACRVGVVSLSSLGWHGRLLEINLRKPGQQLNATIVFPLEQGATCRFRRMVPLSGAAQATARERTINASERRTSPNREVVKAEYVKSLEVQCTALLCHRQEHCNSHGHESGWLPLRREYAYLSTPETSARCKQQLSLLLKNAEKFSSAFNVHQPAVSQPEAVEHHPAFQSWR